MFSGQKLGHPSRHDRTQACVAPTDVNRHVLKSWEEPARDASFADGEGHNRCRGKCLLNLITLCNQFFANWIIGRQWRHLLVKFGELGIELSDLLHLLVTFLHHVQRHERSPLERDLAPFCAQLLQHACAIKDARQRVVIWLRDRIKLVVMTSSTPQGETKKCLANRVDLVIHHVTDHFLLVRIAAIPRSIDEKCGCDQAVGIRFLAVGCWKQVAGNLMGNKLIERQVAIQRFDNPIAIHPRFQWFTHCVPSFGVGIVIIRVTHDIEPVPGPMLTVRGGFQQSIYHALERFA